MSFSPCDGIVKNNIYEMAENGCPYRYIVLKKEAMGWVTQTMLRRMGKKREGAP